MKDRYCIPSASVVMLTRTVGGRQTVLLQRRQNTGFMDGMWDLSCSGHVEYGESMSAAAIREAKEELGVTIAPENLHFFTFVHKRDEEFDLTYNNAYFVCDSYIGEPRICEPRKCEEIEWFDINNLPTDIIKDRLEAVKAYLNGTCYIEFGWSK